MVQHPAAVIATLLTNAGEALDEGVVHVWRFPCVQQVDTSVLSDAERRAAARFHAQVHRDAYAVQHAVVRHLLARYVGHDRLDFTRGPRGKPALTGGELEFNLSHAADVALLAVARGIAVGVDLERLDAPIEQRSLGTIVLAPDEPAPDRAAFLRIWCRKEAALKATGVGLVDDLTAISVAADRADVAGAIVHLQDLAIGSEHAGALATSIAVARVTS